MFKRILVAIPLAFIGAAWFYYLALPWPILLRDRNPETSAVMRQRIAEAEAAGDTLELRHEWVPLEDISRRLQRAVVVAEDGNFREHGGIDWAALREEFRYAGDDDFSWFDPADLRALYGSLDYYRRNRDKVRGRSTITQQLAKNLYYSTDRSLVRKLEEFLVAKRLERQLSKDRIMELYLNLAEWGPGIFGAEAAAQHYFGRSAANLSADQAAALAATLPHPLTSNPDLRPGRMQWRKNMILRRMGGSGPVQTVPLEPLPEVVEPEAPLGDAVGGDNTNVDSATSQTPPPDTILPPPDSSVSGAGGLRRMR